MGVDYDGVGGIGVEFTAEMKDKFISAGFFTEDDWDEDKHECMEKLGIGFCEAGSACYGGTGRFYLLVTGNTLPEILDNEKDFLSQVNRCGNNITRGDLKVISDIYIW